MKSKLEFLMMRVNEVEERGSDIEDKLMERGKLRKKETTKRPGRQIKGNKRQPEEEKAMCNLGSRGRRKLQKGQNRYLNKS